MDGYNEDMDFLDEMFDEDEDVVSISPDNEHEPELPKLSNANRLCKKHVCKIYGWHSFILILYSFVYLF